MINTLEYTKYCLKKSVVFLLILFCMSFLIGKTTYAKEEKNEVEVTFIADEGGQLLDKGTTKKVIRKKVAPGTDVEKIFPKVVPEQGYKFDKWVYPEISNDLKKIQEVKMEYHATFFPDLNNNGIDDRLEEIKVSFDTDSSSKLEDVTIHVGEKIKMPTINKKDYVFVGWYEDSEYTVNFDPQKPILNTVKLYAKWEKMEDLISIQEGIVTIRDSEISNTLEKKLNEKNESKVLEELKSMEEFNQKNLDEATEFSKINHIFDNFNTKNSYMMKFVDRNQEFILSLIIPYGKTVKFFDNKNQMKDEYSIRQNTTIPLEHFDNNSEYLNVTNQTINQINSVEIHTFAKEESKLESKNKLTEVEEAKSNPNLNKVNSKTYLVYALWGACVLGVAYILYSTFRMVKKKKARKMKENNEESDR